MKNQYAPLVLTAEAALTLRRWLVEYKEPRPHDALDGPPPAVYAPQTARTPALKCPLDGEDYAAASSHT